MKERQPQKSDLFTEVNAYLEAKTMRDLEIPTIQGIAEQLGIEGNELNDWVKTDNEFRGGLEKLTKIHDENLFSEPEFDNRADVMLVALFLLETKSRHQKPNI
jgi:hypothetical protein